MTWKLVRKTLFCLQYAVKIVLRFLKNCSPKYCLKYINNYKFM